MFRKPFGTGHGWATLLALVLLAEVPDAITVIGGLVVLVGIYVTTVERERRRGPSPDSS